MKRLNHTLVRDTINKSFNLTSYKQGKFTHFKKGNIEVGYIEQIGATKNYLQTVLVNFFYFDNKELNDKIVNRVEELYKEQVLKDKNYCLELRGNNICKAVLV